MSNFQSSFLFAALLPRNLVNGFFSSSCSPRLIAFFEHIFGQKKTCGPITLHHKENIILSWILPAYDKKPERPTLDFCMKFLNQWYKISFRQSWYNKRNTHKINREFTPTKTRFCKNKVNNPQVYIRKVAWRFVKNRNWSPNLRKIMTNT